MDSRNQLEHKIQEWLGAEATDDDALSCVKPTDIATADPGRWLRLS